MMQKTIKSSLQILVFVWLLVMLFGLPGFRQLVESRSVAQSAQIQNESTDYYVPLVVNYWSSPPSLLISEVLFDPIYYEPAAEWIELYNYSKQGVDLSNIMIGDAENEGGYEGMYNFPTGSEIPSYSVIIITYFADGFEEVYKFKPDFELFNTDPTVPDMIRNTDWAHGSMSLNNAGDEILLLTTSGSPIDLVSWGNSRFAFDPSVPIVEEGHSIERYPPYIDTNSNADWRDQPNPSPGQVDLTPPPTPTPLPATATPTPTASHTPTPTVTSTPTPTLTPFAEAHLLISEVLYDPVNLEPGYEWIEIYNPKLVSIDLTDYKIGDDETQEGGECMLQFPPGVIIKPDEVLVVAHNAENFYIKYGVKPDFEMEAIDPDVPDMVEYPPWIECNIYLDNAGDDVLLLGAGDFLIDALSWGVPCAVFSPPCPDVAEGHSLERYPPKLDTDSADDWRDQAVPNPGEVPSS